MPEVEEKTGRTPLRMRTANEWVAEACARPSPKALFGEFWLEGELCILFADTGKGKSILAVQIAESIASGRGIEPMQLTAEAQKVVYFDFELSGKQFEMRYAEETEHGGGQPVKHYAFSDNFYRAETDVFAEAGENGAVGEAVAGMIEEAAAATGAKVMIIDNLTYLNRGVESATDAIPLMKRLRRLKAEYGLSILVLAHTPKRETRRPLGVNDLQGSKMLANFADNIFAIGQSLRDSGNRYIKHIKPRSTEMRYDFGNVVCFEIAKREDNFLRFVFRGFTSEAAQLVEKRDQTHFRTLERIRDLTAEGLSQRKVGEKLGISKTTVNRYLQMWGAGNPLNYGTTLWAKPAYEPEEDG